MKLSLTTLVLLSATAIAKKVSYDGAKALRIAVGEDVTPVLSIITELKLETWKGMANGIPIAGGHVDLVVPANKVAKFEKLSKGIKVEVMHEDLGLSMAAEETSPALTSRGMLRSLRS